MRFLVDAQLPPALARHIASQGHQAEHVVDVGLESSDDSLNWDYAIAANAAIITKDEDFAIRVSVASNFPAIVWVRIGNTSNRALLDRFAPLLPKIAAALATGEKIVEVT